MIKHEMIEYVLVCKDETQKTTKSKCENDAHRYHDFTDGDVTDM